MKKITVLALETTRTCYGIDDLGDTLTVGEMIEKLEEYPSDMLVCFSNNNGYTFGEIRRELFYRKTEVFDDDN